MIERPMRLLASMLCAVIVVGIAGCEDDNDPRDVSGRWAAQMQAGDDWTQVGHVTLAQDGASVTGTDESGFAVSGSVDGNTLTLTVTTDEGPVVVEVSGEGDTLTGTLTEEGGSQEAIRLVRI